MHRNNFKLLLLHKKPTNSPVKNFLLVIYLLYYRYKVEFAISALTKNESIIVNTLVILLAYGIAKQFYLFVANYLTEFVKCLYAFSLFYRTYSEN
ncbi:hypothetical protein NUSPORA_01188 [Nucleospora cyclopteri]